MSSSGSETPLDREKFDDKFSKRCTAAIFCSGAYVHNKCVAEPEYSSYHCRYIPHPPSLIMRGGEEGEGGATGAAENQYGFDKSNNCSLLPDQAINSTIS
jgi:hypothetical protein